MAKFKSCEIAIDLKYDFIVQFSKITLGKLILDIFTQGKITFPQSFYPKKTRRSVTKNYLQQNIVCLKLQIYPSPENFPLG